MLIDSYLPRFDASERHATLVRAKPAEVYAAIRTAEFGGWPARALLALRGIWHREPVRFDFDHLVQGSFGLVDENAPHEIVLGIEGPFWQPRCRPNPAGAEAFRRPLRPNTALGAWNFTVEPTADGRTRLATETRVLCSDPAARRKFLAYWIVIRLGSGLIRRMILRAIRKEAEK